MSSRTVKMGAALFILGLFLSMGNLFATDATTPWRGEHQQVGLMTGRDAANVPERKKKSTRQKKKDRLREEKKAKEAEAEGTSEDASSDMK